MLMAYVNLLQVQILLCGIGSCTWRIVSDPTDWQNYAQGSIDLGSGITGLLP